jgi:hypothetical protein
MINPIFRSFGVQLFFDNKNVYRYYYRLDLGFEVLVRSPKDGMEIDFFEHILRPEKLDRSNIFTIKKLKDI